MHLVYNVKWQYVMLWYKLFYFRYTMCIRTPLSIYYIKLKIIKNNTFCCLSMQYIDKNNWNSDFMDRIIILQYHGFTLQLEGLHWVIKLYFCYLIWGGCTCIKHPHSHRSVFDLKFKLCSIILVMSSHYGWGVRDNNTTPISLYYTWQWKYYEHYTLRVFYLSLITL
jgi:hypothetical protein